jgi:hypothetical protein
MATNVWTGSLWGPLQDGRLRDLTVAQNEDGRLEVFGVGTDDSVYHSRSAGAPRSAPTRRYGLGVVFDPQRARNGITLTSQAFALRSIASESTPSPQNGAPRESEAAAEAFQENAAKREEIASDIASGPAPPAASKRSQL